MQIPARIPYGLSAVYAAGLFVGLRIFDVSSGAPVQVTGLPGMINNVLPAAQIGASSTFVAYFTAVDQKRYVFVFNAYTDGTYAAVDGTKAEISRDAYARVPSPLFVQGVRIVVGCKNQPDQSPVWIAQNSDGNVLLSFFDELGNPVDVSAATGLAFKVLESDGVTILTKVPAPVAGVPYQLLVSLLAADLALLAPGFNDAQVFFSLAGVNYVENLAGALNVLIPSS